MIIFFWYSLLSSNKFIPKLHLVAISLFHSFVLLALPSHAGFTYVQTVLVLTFNLYDIFFRPIADKDVAYKWVGLVSLPFSVVAWLEGTACQHFLRAVGGHAWYDASIPSAILIYYFAVRGLEKKLKGAKSNKLPGILPHLWPRAPTSRLDRRVGRREKHID